MEDELMCTNNNCRRIDYYDFKDVCSDLNNNERLGVLHLNIRSINKNFSLFLSHLEQIAFKFHIIVLTETWLCEPNLDAFQIPYYNAFSTPSCGKSGGIRVFVKNSITTQSYNVAHRDTFQSLNLIIKLPFLGDVFLGAIYKSPTISNLNFNDSFEEAYSECFSPSQKIIFVGDFNLDLFQNDNIQIDRFSNFMRSLNCFFYITEATRDPPDSQSCTLIDHLWSNIVVPSESYVVECMITDHFPIATLFSTPEIQNNNDIFIVKFRDFSAVNQEKMFFDAADLYYLQQEDLTSCNIDNSLNNFVLWLTRMTNKYFPVKNKQISRKSLNAPWITSRIKQCIEKKHHLYKLFKQGIISRTHFNKYKNKLLTVLRLSKQYYYNVQFNVRAPTYEKPGPLLIKL